MRTLAYFALFVASLAACDDPYDPDAPAIDPDAPRVHITSPERGTFAGDVTSIEVEGTASDGSGVIVSVLVNGVAAVVDEGGKFRAIVPVVPGTNLLHAVAKDPQGNTGKESRAVVAGKLSSIDRTIPSAITATLSAQTFDALGRGASGFIETADLGVLVQPMNPVLDLGTTGGVPDCLYAQATITGMDVGDATIQLAPQTGGIYLDAILDNVTVNMHLQWAVSCLDGSREVTVSASRLHVQGMLAVGIAWGQFEIALQDPNVELVGLNVDLGGVPQTIIDMLSLDTRLGPVLAWATERFVVPMLNSALAGLNETKSVDVLGKTIDITVAPHRIELDVAGAVVELDTELRAQGDGASPGFVYVPNQVPAMDKSTGFQLAIADDGANQLLGSLWAAKAMEVGFDLQTGDYGEVGKLYDRVEVSASVPPYVDATGEALKLTIGDLVVSFKNAGSLVTQIAVNAELELEVVATPDGALRLDVGQPTTYVDILDEGVEGSNQLSNAQFEAVSTFALSRIIAFGSGAVGAIPLPAVGGVAVKDVKVGQQTGYLVVDGKVQ